MELDEYGDPVDVNGDGVLGISDIDWDATWGNLGDDEEAAIELITRAILAEEGTKLGTDRHDDAVGVAWAIRNRREDNLYANWQGAAVSMVHGMNSTLARDPMNGWSIHGVFNSQRDAWRAYNLARDVAQDVLNADESKDITQGAHYWTDASCDGTCESDDQGRVTNPIPWNRTHFRTVLSGRSRCVMTVLHGGCR